MPKFRQQEPSHVGDRLRALIDRSGLYPAEVARRAGMHKQTLHNILSGARNPGFETVERLVAAMEMTLADLDATARGRNTDPD